MDRSPFWGGASHPKPTKATVSLHPGSSFASIFGVNQCPSPRLHGPTQKQIKSQYSPKMGESWRIFLFCTRIVLPGLGNVQHLPMIAFYTLGNMTLNLQIHPKDPKTFATLKLTTQQFSLQSCCLKVSLSKKGNIVLFCSKYFLKFGGMV